MRPVVKIHFGGKNMGHFRRRPAPRSLGNAGAGGTRVRAARRGRDRPAASGRPPTLLPRAGRRSGDRPEHGCRGLRPARRRRLAHRRAGVRHAGVQAPGRDRAGSGRRRVTETPDSIRPQPGLARRVRVPALGMARRHPSRARRGLVSVARLRRPARTAGAASRARRLCLARPRGPGDSRPRGGLLGLHPGVSAGV